MVRLRSLALIVATGLAASAAAWVMIRSAEGPPLNIEPSLFPGSPENLARAVDLREKPTGVECTSWGLRLARRSDGRIEATSVVRYLPAARAGLLPGDRLV